MLHYFPLLSSMQSLWYHASLVALDGLSSPGCTLELVWIPCQLVSLCYPCMGFDFAIYCSVFKLEFGEIKELHCHHNHHQREIFFSLFYSPPAIISCYFQFLWSGVCLEKGDKRWVESSILTGTVISWCHISWAYFVFVYFSSLMGTCVIFLESSSWKQQI